MTDRTQELKKEWDERSTCVFSAAVIVTTRTSTPTGL
jgi:hypothetical protein